MLWRFISTGSPFIDATFGERKCRTVYFDNETTRSIIVLMPEPNCISKNTTFREWAITESWDVSDSGCDISKMKYLAAIKVIAKHGWWNTTLPLPGPQSISPCAEASSTNPRWWLPESTNQNAASPLLSTNQSADNRVALLAIRWACHRHLCPSCQNLAQFFPWSSKNRQHWPPWVLKSSHISGNYQCGQIKVGKNLARWALNASMEITVKRGGGWVSQVGSSINPQSATVPPFPHRYHRQGRRGGIEWIF